MSIVKSSAESLTLNADGSGNDVIIQSNGSTKVTVDGQNSRVGIGTTSPQELLEISGNSSPAIEIDNTSQRWRIGAGWAGGTSSELFIHDKTDNRLDVLLDGTGNVKVVSGNLVIGTSGKGIDFSATSDGSGTDTSELLDDYEEGTWTPVLTDLTNNATMHALTAGVYTKIGRLVTVTANVRTSSLGSVSGNLYVTGFPYTSANTDGNHGAGAVANAENMNITAGHAITLYVGKNGAKGRFDIYDTSQGITGLQSGEWSSDGMAAITATYSI